MQPQGLPRSSRLHLKRDFERIILGGKKIKGNGIILWYGLRPDKLPARFAVVVSKKLGPAVVRNRTKRLLREAFRLSRKDLVCGVDIIVSPRDSAQLGNVHAAQEALKSLCGKSALLALSATPLKTSGENK